MALLTLPNVLAGILVLSLNAYALMGGADYGGGIWDLLAGGPRRREQRALVADAIGPIWEANHVWLILVVVLVFTCFPPAFARFGIVLNVPLTLMLIGVVLRGSAFTFRSYDDRRDAVQSRWGTTFAIASVATPVLLGVCIGAIASGRVGEADLARGFGPALMDPWLTPFALAVGVFTLVLFAYLAAVYLTLEAAESPELETALHEDFRRRAIASWVAVLAAAVLVLLLSGEAAPRLRAGLTEGGWALALHLATATAALAALWALVVRRYAAARVAAIVQVSCILWGWAWAQFPYLAPPTLTIADAAAPRSTLQLALVGVVVGFALLIPSLWYLFRVFKGEGTAFQRAARGR